MVPYTAFFDLNMTSIVEVLKGNNTGYGYLRSVGWAITERAEPARLVLKSMRILIELFQTLTVRIGFRS